MALLSCKKLLFPRGRSSVVKGALRNLMSKQLYYSQFGDPVNVVKFKESVVPELGETDVLVRMLAAPVNPADINTIQGTYPVKVELPCVPGNEGVGIVEDVGKAVQGIGKGNKVIVTKPVQGTWRDLAAFKKDVLRVVPDKLGVVEAATLTVNPCTAYRMLTDFVPVKQKGLVVIQNGANSACGQNVIQICKAWGVKTVNIVRDRPEIDDLKKYLTDLGATFVLTEEELRSTTIFKEKKIDKPTLALNCVGGKNSSEMLRYLQHSGKMVTYGGMSRKPVIIPTSAFIFKNATFHGFWMTAWNEKASQSDKDKMMSDIIALMCDGKLKGPVHKMVKFENYPEAIGNALTVKGFTGCAGNMLPDLPTVPGDEGVGNVVEIGKLVSRVKVGDRVIITKPLLGTWRYYGIYEEMDLYIISPNIPVAEASMLAAAPATAFRMMNDFYPIEHGETVVQNAANSPVGQCVIQVCRAMGINTVNILSTLCNYETVRSHLENIGATTVFTLQEAEAMSSFLTSLRRPILGINCLGGRHTNVLFKMLARNGAIISYGSAFDIPVPRLRSDVCLYTFNLKNWYEDAQIIEKYKMISQISQLMALGKMRAPIYLPLELKNYTVALKNTAQCEAFSTLSFVFDFTLP